MGRRYPDAPVVGVSGVVLDKDKVLLVKRGHAPAKGLWSLPGGALELGETARAGCAREVLEETGLSVTVGPLVETVDRIHRDPEGRVEYHYLLLDFLCRAKEGRVVAGSDAAAAAWVPVTELCGFHLTADTEEIIVKAAELGRKHGFVN